MSQDLLIKIDNFQEEDEAAGLSEKELEEAKNAAKELQAKQVGQSAKSTKQLID